MKNSLVTVDSRDGAMKESGDIILSGVSTACTLHDLYTTVLHVHRMICILHSAACDHDVLCVHHVICTPDSLPS